MVLAACCMFIVSKYTPFQHVCSNIFLTGMHSQISLQNTSLVTVQASKQHIININIIANAIVMISI